MGFFDSLLEMLGFTSKTTTKTPKSKQEKSKKNIYETKQQAALLEQRREAHYIDLAEDQYDEDRIFGTDESDDSWGYNQDDNDDMDSHDTYDNHYSYASSSSSHDNMRDESHYNDDYIDEFDDDGENYDGYDYDTNYRPKWDEVKTNRSWGNSFGTDSNLSRKSNRDNGFDDYDDNW